MINSKIILHSKNIENGKEIVTFELEYPRFIHSEFMTHRVFSRNAASSRAIPFKNMVSLVWNNMAEPIYWGKNKPGMKASEEVGPIKKYLAKKIWRISGKVACAFAYLLNFLGVHKQTTNRILEPWSHIKVVATATELNNFFALRLHEDAQPEIRELALKMKQCLDNSKPQILKEGEWHLPYVTDSNLDLEVAKKVSASLCAQVSYRKADESIDKAVNIFGKLIESKPVHASPVEHQAKATKELIRSGNLIGFKQFRQDIKDNYVE